MKKLCVLLLILLMAFSVIGCGGSIAEYNERVAAQEAVEKAKSDVTVNLKRRADLIPGFVAVSEACSGCAESEYIVLTKARAAVYDASTAEELAAASTRLDTAVDGWVKAVTEAYPEIKSDKNYISLLDELASTANRIKTAIRDYNEAVQEYNKLVSKDEKQPFFETDSDIEIPQVSFD